MATYLRIALTAVILGVLLCGCSGQGSQPVVPDETNSNPELTGNSSTAIDTTGNGHYLLLYNQIYIDAENPDDPIIDIIPVREGEMHLNILKFLEDGPCFNCFKLVGFNFPQPGILDVDIQIDHPFTGFPPDDPLLYSLFDVRGIMMFNGNHGFPIAGKKISDPALGDGILLNADGYTALYNGKTFSAPTGDLLKYYPGNFSTPAIPNSDINGYKYFITDDPSNNRNAFIAGSSDTVTFSLKLPTGPFVLGYAVDANWWLPTTQPVGNPLTDFDTNANCPEPWKIVVTEEPIGDGLTDQGGSTKLIIDVYDWQGKDTHHEPVVECPELFDGQLTATWDSTGPGYSRYEVAVSNDKLADVGEFWYLAGVEANENNPSGTPWLDLTSYQLQILTVAEKIIENPVAVAEASPNPQVVNLPVSFSGSDSHDPDGGDIQLFEWDWEYDSMAGFVPDQEGENVDHTWSSAGTHLVQLRVTDDEGETDLLDEPIEIEITETSQEIWGLSWGGNGEDSGYGVAGDSLGNTYVTGCFSSTVDFDPGDGVVAYTGPGVFLSKFDSTGDFIWVKAWAASSYDSGNGFVDIAISNTDEIYVTGTFNGPVDFDPGSGEENHTTNGSYDVFLSKFDTSGNFIWVKTWGGSSFDEGLGVATDTSGNVFVTGFFYLTVDFDPGSGVDNHTSNGDDDSFLSKFDSAGNFLWAKTWGGTVGNNPGVCVAVDLSGNALVTGMFRGGFDFDPGTGIDNHVAQGSMDVYVSKFDSSGDFVWANTWGGSEGDRGYGVAVDGSENVYVTGGFWSPTVDFDPGGGVDIHNTNGDADAFLSKFDSSGDFIWAKTWGGAVNNEIGNAIAVETSGIVYVNGCFNGTVDFDPGSGVDNHVANGPDDTFLSKFDTSGDFEWAITWNGGTDYENGYGVALGSLGSIYVTGFFDETVNFDSEGSGDEHSSNGLNDAFLCRFPSN